MMSILFSGINILDQLHFTWKTSKSQQDAAVVHKFHIKENQNIETTVD